MDIYKLVGAFLLGAASGIGGTYLYFKKVIEEENLQFEEDLKALRQEFAEDFERFRRGEIERDLDSNNDRIRARAQKEMAGIAKNKDESMILKDEYDTYIDYAAQYQQKPKKKKKGFIRILKEDDPLVNADSDYDVVNCSFYADNILSEDGTDEIIENVKECVGLALDRFAGEGVDEIFVANDKQKLVYDITKDIRRYWGDIRNGNMDGPDID